MMRLAHDPTPKSRVRILSYMWFVFAVLSMIGIGVGAHLVTAFVAISPTNSYVGTLTPDRAPIELKLPAGLPLKSVLVETGEAVRAGQTVATLDRAVMQAELDNLKRSISFANLLRSCLIDTTGRHDTDFATSYAKLRNSVDDTKNDDDELQILFRAALAECATRYTTSRVKIDRLQRARRILNARSALLDQKLALVLAGETKRRKRSASPVLQAHASVSLALEKNEVTQKLHTLMRELDIIRGSQDQKRLAYIAKISKEVAAHYTQRALLEKYLEMPRLVVPGNGVVSRVRPIQAGAKFDTEEMLLEVRSADAAQYNVELQVPLSELDVLPIGTDVEIKLAGFGGQGPLLKGRIEKWVAGNGGTGKPFVIAKIDLVRESQANLADPRHGIALRGRTTASVVRAQLPARSLRELLIAAVDEKTGWARTIRARLFSP